MNLRDLRVKRAGEVLNGIKVVKLFSLEKVQLARLQRARDKELGASFKFAICMSGAMLISTVSAPLMTSIAFIALTFTDKF